ncbi:MAG: leucine-rich repeat domain-containing protein [Treponema sp.]|nr:leucine-rich repeat domain-containing protein [Treponema sp.]
MRKTARNGVLWAAVCAAFVMLAGCSIFDTSDDGSNGDSPNPSGSSGQQPGQVTTCTVTFYPNVPTGAVGAGVLAVQTRTCNSGSTYQIPDGLFTLDGYRLAGWADSADAARAEYPAGYQCTVYSNRSFYAVWEISINTTVNGLVIRDNVVVEFMSDSGITAVVIPDGVVAIEDGVFGGCGSLTVTYAGTEEQWNALGVDTKDIYVIYGNGTTSGGIQPSELTIENRVVVRCDPKATGYIRIPSGVTGIAANAFEGCSSLEIVIIPDGVVSIGGNAFKGCTNLLSIEMPGSVRYIGFNAFEYCNTFKTVNFTGTLSRLTTLGLDTNNFGVSDISVVCRYGTPDEGVCHFGDALTIVDNVVKSCDQTLTGYVIIPDGVTEIASEAFKDCADIMGIGIPGSVTFIGDEAFKNCSSLSSVVVSNTQMKIGKLLNDGCDKLTGFCYTGTLAEWIASDRYWAGVSEIDGKPVSEITELTADDFAGVTKIGNNAFQGWRELHRVTIPNYVTDIGYSPFVVCTSLTSITVESGNRRYHSDSNCLIETGTKTLIAGCNTSIIPMDGSVTSIAEMSFAACIGLTSVTIPDGVTYIDVGVFLRCISLTSVKIPSSITSISPMAFDYCDSLTTVHYGGTETEWNKISRGKFDGLSGKTIIGSDGSTWIAK